MKISSKLLIIVFFTIIQVTFTAWAAFQISKGATFHNLNFLHLKYVSQYENVILSIENGGKIDLDKLERVITDIRQQPIDCLDQLNFIDKKLMQVIGTGSAIDLCIKDIDEANEALASLEDYKSNEVGKVELVSLLRKAENEFRDNSLKFEEPISKTVSFTLRTMIPLVVIISLFNIVFIAYLSRSITSSITDVVNLLSSKDQRKDIDREINTNISGELLQLLAVARARAKDDLLNLETSEELKSIVSEQTTELSGLVEELTQFSYRTSHDLKAPLVTSRRLAVAIREDIEDAEYEEAKSNSLKIEKQLTRLENLVTDILNLSRADSLDEDKQQVNISKVVAGIKAELKDLSADNNVEIGIDIDTGFEIFESKVRIVQILDNLISNGIKYSDPDKEHRYVKVSAREANGVNILTVEDNGLGIPAQFHDRVFAMFERFHPSVSSGSGLGIYIVKKHADKMGAEIDFASSDRGTKIQLEFPKEFS